MKAAIKPNVVGRKRTPVRAPIWTCLAARLLLECRAATMTADMFGVLVTLGSRSFMSDWIKGDGDAVRFVH
jgi:hypothetical protein